MPGFGKGGLLPTARGLELGPAKTLSHRLRALQLGVDGHNEVASVDPAAVPCGSPKAAAYPSGSVRRAQDSWLVWTPGGHRRGLVRLCRFCPRSEKRALGSGAPGQKRDLGRSLFLQYQQPREGRGPLATAMSSVVCRGGSVESNGKLGGACT